MKKILIFLIIMFVLPSILAINLNVEEQSSNEVLVQGINQPAIFNIKITNLGDSDDLQFYNLLGFSMAPKGTVHFGQGNAKSIDLMIFPRDDFQTRGFYTFQYFIRGNDGTEISQDVTIKIIDLIDVFEIGSGEINPESNSLEIYIHNKENFNFEDVNVKFKSAFFEKEEIFQLGANERKNFEIELDKDDFKKLMAGFYTLNAEINVNDLNIELEGTIKFNEKDILTSTKKDFGFFINTKIIEKKNEGNVMASTETLVIKNLFSRLFTSFSPEPDIVERNGINIYYTWFKEIKPGESFNITVKTNWIFLLIVILFIISITILAKQYSRTDVDLKKKVSFVRAKGGEFALKVTVLLTAKTHVEKLSVIDRLPPIVKVYERFGGEKPKRVSEKNRRVEWDFDELEVGETRVLSYIIYSKIGILGKFALPKATAIYEKDGKIHESESNKAFFISEQKTEKFRE